MTFVFTFYLRQTNTFTVWCRSPIKTLQKTVQTVSETSAKEPLTHSIGSKLNNYEVKRFPPQSLQSC